MTAIATGYAGIGCFFVFLCTPKPADRWVYGTLEPPYFYQNRISVHFAVYVLHILRRLLQIAHCKLASCQVLSLQSATFGGFLDHFGKIICFLGDFDGIF